MFDLVLGVERLSLNDTMIATGGFGMGYAKEQAPRYSVCRGGFGMDYVKNNHHVTPCVVEVSAWIM